MPPHELRETAAVADLLGPLVLGLSAAILRVTLTEIIFFFFFKFSAFNLMHSAVQNNPHDDETSCFPIDCYFLVTTNVGSRGGYVNQQEYCV